MKLNYKTFTALSAGLLSILIYSGCKKYDNPPPVFEELKNIASSPRKVLIISIDGVTGSELKTIAPPVITGLQKNSKYSYNTLKTASDAAGWVSMVTGTGYSKHEISNDNFQRTQNPNDDLHGTITSYRNVLDYVTQYKAVTTAMVTSWGNLRNYLRNADFAPVVTNDLAVKDSTINILTNQAALGTILVNFREVQGAGDNGGYVASNTNYKNAILKADEHVGSILTALKARKNYAKEDWLVIITTNHGGSSANPENGFTMVYHPLFKEFELKKSGFNSVLFNSTSKTASVEDDHGLYDPGIDNDFTVQMQIKMVSTTSYPALLSKGVGIDGSTQTGWLVMLSGGSWGMSVGGTLNASGVGRQQVAGGTTLGDLNWHTMTFTVKRVNSTTRTMTTFTDGVQNATGNINSHKSLSSNQPLKVGFNKVDNSGSANFYAANLTYFNTALDAATIAANKDLKDITKHPNYANLIGYWPMDEGTEGTFFNKAPQGYNMALAGAYTWNNLAALFPPGTTAEPVTSSLSIPSTVSDVSALTLYWMKIPILVDFGLDGKPFLNKFEIEFLKD